MKKQQIVSSNNIEQKSISVNYGLCASILQPETVCLSSLDSQFLHVPFYCIISLISKCATQNGPRGLIWCSFGWLGLGTRCPVSPLLDHHHSVEITLLHHHHHHHQTHTASRLSTYTWVSCQFSFFHHQVVANNQSQPNDHHRHLDDHHDHLDQCWPSGWLRWAAGRSEV